jgi:hypothetical protein
MKGPNCPYYNLLRGHYIAIILVRYEGPLSALSIALHRDLYIAIIMDRYE